MKKFGITGVTGYIAPRHLRAIKDTGNILVAAADPNDSVGILDQYFPDADFFTEIERFERHLDKLRRKGEGIDYLSICTPNHLHDAHIRLALRNGADAICEKPVVLNPWNLDALSELELAYNKKVNIVLQLRLHPEIVKLKQKIENEKNEKRYEIELIYVTSRGKWYDFSWKGDIQKSGGVATNIGIHFFDMLTWIFGKVENIICYINEPRRVAGNLILEKANVKWYLSLERSDIQKLTKDNSKTTFRILKIDNEEFLFSDGFTDLHTKVYENILQKRGFGLDDSRQSIQIVHYIRNIKKISKVNKEDVFFKHLI